MRRRRSLEIWILALTLAGVAVYMLIQARRDQEASPGWLGVGSSRASRGLSFRGLVVGDSVSELRERLPLGYRLVKSFKGNAVTVEGPGFSIDLFGDPIVRLHAHQAASLFLDGRPFYSADQLANNEALFKDLPLRRRGMLVDAYPVPYFSDDPDVLFFSLGRDAAIPDGSWSP